MFPLQDICESTGAVWRFTTLSRKKLRAHPELIDIARENLHRWYAGAGRSQPYLDEWLRILDLPLEEVLSLMEQDGERMTALRQSSPFAGILDPAERWAVYTQVEPVGGGEADVTEADETNDA